MPTSLLEPGVSLVREIGGRAATAVAQDQAPPRAHVTLPYGELETFTRNLELQLEAGVPLARALQVQRDHAETRAAATLCDGVLRQLTAGVTLADALEAFPRAFSPVYRSLVRAGEQSGRLPLLLRELAQFLAWREEIRRTVRRAATYPTLVLLATCGLFLLIVGYVLPKFEGLFQRLGDDIPTAARLLLGAGKFIAEQWHLLALGAAGAPVVFVVLLRASRTRRALFIVAGALPILGRVLTAIDLARLTRTLAVLTHAGIPLIRALELARDAIANARLADQVARVRESVTGGQTLAQALAAAPVFPPIAASLVTIGEESGQMTTVLDRLATNFDRAARDTADKAMALLEPAFTVALAVLVGGLAIVVLSTLYRTMMAVGQ